MTKPAEEIVATVLAVDDETENAALVQRSLLLRPNLGVLVAFSGTEALAIFWIEPNWASRRSDVSI